MKITPLPMAILFLVNASFFIAFLSSSLETTLYQQSTQGVSRLVLCTIVFLIGLTPLFAVVHARHQSTPPIITTAPADNAENMLAENEGAGGQSPTPDGTFEKPTPTLLRSQDQDFRLETQRREAAGQNIFAVDIEKPLVEHQETDELEWLSRILKARTGQHARTPPELRTCSTCGLVLPDLETTNEHVQATKHSLASS